jgi:hypothetical protein
MIAFGQTSIVSTGRATSSSDHRNRSDQIEQAPRAHRFA